MEIILIPGIQSDSELKQIILLLNSMKRFYVLFQVQLLLFDVLYF